MQITITIDPTVQANSQNVYCKEIDSFLDIVIIPHTVVDDRLAIAQGAVLQDQKDLDALLVQKQKRDDALAPK